MSYDFRNRKRKNFSDIWVEDTDIDTNELKECCEVPKKKALLCTLQQGNKLFLCQ